jgi:hypothetical protein
VIDDRTYVTQARVLVVKHLREFTPKGIERATFDHLVEVLEQLDAVLGNGSSITCPECGWTSYHPGDIDARYCGHCHQTHDVMAVLRAAKA